MRRGSLTGLKLAVLLAALVCSASWLPSSGGQGGLVVAGGETFAVEGRTVIQTGNVTVEGGGTLLIKGGELQLSIRGEKSYNITVEDGGKLVVEGGNLTALAEGSTILLKGNLTLVGARVVGFSAIKLLGNASFLAKGSRMEVGGVSGNCSSFGASGLEAPGAAISFNCSTAFVDGLRAGSLNLNATEASIRGFDGEALRALALRRVEVAWSRAGSASLYGLGGVSVRDSEFGSFVGGAFGNVYNVTTREPSARAGGAIRAFENSTLFRYWYLTVSITDLTALGVPANVTIQYLNGTGALRASSDAAGRLRIPVLAEVVKGSETIFVGNYLIQAWYKNYSTPKLPLTMDGNKEVSLKFYYFLPFESATTIQLSSEEVKAGGAIEVRGRINPPVEGALIEIHYIGPGGLEDVRAVFASADGSFLDRFSPGSPGRWVVYADWVGGEAYAGGKVTFSQRLAFYVEERPPVSKLLLALAPILIIVVSMVVALALLLIRRRRP